MGDVDVNEFLNQWKEQKVSYNKRDLLLYACGIGCGTDASEDLRYVYENDENFAAFPTYPIVLTFKGTDQDVVSFPSEAMMEGPPMPPLPGVKVALDGERYIEKCAELPVDGAELTVKGRYVGVHKRGSGASLEKEEHILDKDGKLLYKIISGAFLVGAKGFKDAGVSYSETVKPPSKTPDAVVECPTTKTQTHIYRLSGDYNPLHIEEGFAQMSGFKEPILHGLCSLGITARAVINKYCDGDSARFKAIKVRFAKPVFPGDTLVVEMWKDGDKIIVQTRSKTTGDICLNNGYVLLNPEAKL